MDKFLPMTFSLEPKLHATGVGDRIAEFLDAKKVSIGKFFSVTSVSLECKNFVQSKHQIDVPELRSALQDSEAGRQVED
jgi:hypothetical protein